MFGRVHTGRAYDADPELAEQLLSQINDFGFYAFSESHPAPISPKQRPPAPAPASISLGLH
jgi:hypothetical protein